MPELLLVLAGLQQALAQQDELLAEFVLQLSAVKVHRDFEIGEHIVTKEHAMAKLHVEELDGENVGGALDFLAGEKQRGVSLLASPPVDDRNQFVEIGKRGLAENAE